MYNGQSAKEIKYYSTAQHTWMKGIIIIVRAIKKVDSLKMLTQSIYSGLVNSTAVYPKLLTKQYINSLQHSKIMSPHIPKSFAYYQQKYSLLICKASHNWTCVQVATPTFPGATICFNEVMHICMYACTWECRECFSIPYVGMSGQRSMAWNENLPIENSQKPYSTLGKTPQYQTAYCSESLSSPLEEKKKIDPPPTHTHTQKWLHVLSTNG